MTPPAFAEAMSGPDHTPAILNRWQPWLALAVGLACPLVLARLRMPPGPDAGPLRPRMVVIPTGSFLMGESSGVDLSIDRRPGPDTGVGPGPDTGVSPGPGTVLTWQRVQYSPNSSNPANSRSVRMFKGSSTALSPSAEPMSSGSLPAAREVRQ